MQIRMVRDQFGLLYVQPKALGVFVSFVFWEEGKKRYILNVKNKMEEIGVCRKYNRDMESQEQSTDKIIFYKVGNRRRTSKSE